MAPAYSRADWYALRQNPDGSVSPMGLLDIDGISWTQVGGRTLPSVDPQLAASAPRPSAPDYAAQAQAFIRANAPEQWEGQRVGFYTAFLSTVTLQEAHPGGSDPTLLPGFAQEIWGLPVSRPTRDPRDPEVVYLRWERGVMAYDRRLGGVQVAQLGEVFKAILTGENLPADLAADDNDNAGDNDNLTADDNDNADSGSADLSISQRGSPERAGVGQTVTYTLRVVNDGPDDAQGVVLIDRLPPPADSDFVDAAAGRGGSCSRSGTTVTCTLGTLAESASWEVTVRVRPKTAGVTLTNRARVDSDEDDPDTADTTDDETTRVT